MVKGLSTALNNFYRFVVAGNKDCFNWLIYRWNIEAEK